ncbi:PsbP-related protein [Richelia intracellularis]|uniref:PsbP-related protein n=1 Tax=Richelia intracellularis TaxID=1164990 RepID=UPI001E60D5F1|nr:PsbP-related protein [Richelia intracellularis]
MESRENISVVINPVPEIKNLTKFVILKEIGYKLDNSTLASNSLGITTKLVNSERKNIDGKNNTF